MPRFVLHLILHLVLPGLILSLIQIFPKTISAAPPKRPNILVCMADDASFPFAGVYGCKWIKTPNFDRLAQEGLLFRRAYTPNAKCSPSRACFLTGRYPWQLEEAANHIAFVQPKYVTYAETLRNNGYFVGLTSKGWAPEITLDEKGNPRNPLGVAFDKRRTTPPTKRINNSDYAGNFRDFLDAKPADKPWCFWYGSTEPHRNYEYGSGSAVGKKSIDQIDRVPGYWPDNEVVRNDMLDFAFELEYFDLHVGKMIALLEERGELDNTLIVVTADNGMPFPRAKGCSYEVSCHLPLAIYWKDGISNPGRTIDDYVSFVDFAPTFLDVAGIDPKDTTMQPMTGNSLLDIFLSEKSGQINPERNFAVLGRERNDVGRPNDEGYPTRGLVKDDFLFLRNFEPTRWPACNPETGYLDVDGSPTKTTILQNRLVPDHEIFWKLSFAKRGSRELYDMKNDPDCLVNLAENSDQEILLKEMETELIKILEEHQDPRILGHGSIFDKYPFGTKATHDFYNRWKNGEAIQQNANWVNQTDFSPEPIDD
ncbi:MAG: sulfatase family protein [Thermoguttaceae bacterium]